MGFSSGNGCSATIGEKIEDGEDRHRRLVSTNFDVDCEDASRIELVFADSNMRKSFTRVVADSRRNKAPVYKSSKYSSWHGENEEDGSSFQFVQDEDGHMAGSIVDMENHNVVQIHTKGGQRVATITPSSDFPAEGEPIVLEPIRRKLKESRPVVERRNLFKSLFHQKKPGTTPRLDYQKSQRNLFDDLGGNLDIMVIYTRKAACRAYGEFLDCEVTDEMIANMEQIIALAVAETNVAYSSSGVDTELLLVHSYMHPTYEETDLFTALDDMSSGAMSGVHAERKVHGADMVALILHATDRICGLGYVGPLIDFMYSTVQVECATGIYTFAHEVNHNLGLFHDRGTEGACGIEGYNYGYRDPQARLRTVMAYDCTTDECDNNAGGGCDRIARFSTPDFTFNGIPLGRADSEDAARTINENRVETAGFFEHGLFITDAPSTVPTTTQNPSAAPCVEGETDVEVRFFSDDFPLENSWVIENDGTVYASGGNFTLGNKQYISENCLDAKFCYTFTFKDTFGDGLLYQSNFELVVDGATTFQDLPSETRRGFTAKSTDFGLCTDSPTTSPPTTIPTVVPSQIPTVSNTTKTPSEFPSATFSPSTSPTYSTTAWCIDTHLKFRLKKSSDFINRDCKWVARRMTRKRCNNMKGVNTMCPRTCGVCVPCTDGTLKFRFRKNKRLILRRCGKCFSFIFSFFQNNVHSCLISLSFSLGEKEVNQTKM